MHNFLHSYIVRGYLFKKRNWQKNTFRTFLQTSQINSSDFCVSTQMEGIHLNVLYIKEDAMRYRSLPNNSNRSLYLNFLRNRLLIFTDNISLNFGIIKRNGNNKFKLFKFVIKFVKIELILEAVLEKEMKIFIST